MKRLLACILLLSTLCVRAEQLATEKPIPEDEKSRIAQVIREALKDKSITKQQYDQAMVWLNSTPCNGVDRSLSEARKKELAAAIAKQEGLESIDVYQSFKSDGWTIVYVDTHISDQPYLFYSGALLRLNAP